MKVVGVGLPKTGTTTLKKALDILGIDNEVGDFVHILPNYPKADVYILTIRETPQVWFDSVLRWDKVVGDREVIKRQRIRMYGSEKPKKNWIDKYNDHNDLWRGIANCHVLCWERGDSWCELCEILGVDIPAVPFPHENKNTRT